MNRNRWERKHFYKRIDSAPEVSVDDDVIEISLCRIVLSDKNRIALQRDNGQIEVMRRTLELGDSLLPIRVRKLADGLFDIKDGRHRYLAHELAGMSTINCVIS